MHLYRVCTSTGYVRVYVYNVNVFMLYMVLLVFLYLGTHSLSLCLAGYDIESALSPHLMFFVYNYSLFHCVSVCFLSIPITNFTF
jgi:hypothetical protein